MNIFILVKSFILLLLKFDKSEYYQCDYYKNYGENYFSKESSKIKSTPCIRLRGHFGKHKTFYD
jgi:hypothetical protein